MLEKIRDRIHLMSLETLGHQIQKTGLKIQSGKLEGPELKERKQYLDCLQSEYERRVKKKRDE